MNEPLANPFQKVMFLKENKALSSDFIREAVILSIEILLQEKKNATHLKT